MGIRLLRLTAFLLVSGVVGLASVAAAAGVSTQFTYPTTGFDPPAPGSAGGFGGPWYEGKLHVGVDVNFLSDEDIRNGVRVDVRAIAPGRVYFAGPFLSANPAKWGDVVFVEHPSPAGVFVAVYGHVVIDDDIGAVSFGSRDGPSVRHGQVLGYVDPAITGSPPHLHFGLFRGQFRYFPRSGWGAVPPNEFPGRWVGPEDYLLPSGPYGAGPTTTVFVLDRSGSMEWITSDRQEKMAAAQSAAKAALRLIRFDADSLGADHQVGVVAFSNSAEALCPPTSDCNDVEWSIDTIRPSGATNFGEALGLAVGWLENAGPGRRIIIFLSDGVTNVGPVDHDAFLTDDPDSLPLYRRIRDAGIKVYTVGFGDPGRTRLYNLRLEPDIDEEVLRRIADTPGTGGGYMYASDASRLSYVYLSSVHAATGTRFFEEEGLIAMGERKTLGPFDPAASGDVAAVRGSHLLARAFSVLITPAYAGQTEDSQMLITLGWNAGILGLEIRDPSGRVVDQSYPGAHIDTSCQPYCIAIDSPSLGNWTAVVSGESVPDEGTRYNFIASARVPALPPVVGSGATSSSSDVWQQAGLLVLLVAIMLLAVACVVVARRRCAVPLLATPGRASVQGPGGGFREMELRAAVVRVGRAEDNDIVLADPQASLHHAILRYDGTTWSVEDLGSKNGTLVNEQQVTAAILRAGDRLQIGGTTIRPR